MDRHTLQVLGFARLCDILSEGALSPQGKDLCLAVQPCPSLEAARQELDDLEALRALESALGPPPTAGLQRVEEALETARKEGARLEVEALLAVRDTVATCHRVLEYLEDAGAEGSPLGVRAGRIRPRYDLADRFERTFGSRGEILDSASAALQQLRFELARLRERILKALSAVLKDSDFEPAVQDDFVTVRGNRYVIPLRTDFRGYLKGIVHDRSRTGATFFVEPLEVVELNNRLDSLREEEEAEIRRILALLTAAVGGAAAVLLANISEVARLDSLGARLKLARRLGGVRPDLVDSPVLELRGARHPFLLALEGVQVVPIDFLLGGDTQFLLITGANAGGKTVSLKTAGLLTLMGMSGLFIPAQPGSRIGWFHEVYADIGDEQDIDRSLSTFSAHIAHLRQILERAEAGSLVLLDELGTGTDPQEGVALAMAELDVLLEQGALVAGSTHLAGLKAFAYSCSRGQNAAVAFDPESGNPLYRLVYGTAGTSNALEVASQLGMPARVMEKARAYASVGGESGYGFLRDLERAKEQAVRAAEEAEALRTELQEKLARQSAVLEEAKAERDRARESLRKEITELIQGARLDLRRTIRGFAAGKATQQEAEAAIQGAGENLGAAARPELPESPALSASEIAVGAGVRVSSLMSDGVVEAIEEESRKAVVRLGAIRAAVPIEDLRKASRKSAGKPEVTSVARVESSRGVNEVVVVGCTVEDALARVDKALDRARVADARGLRVVHGRGTGALRRAVEGFLTRSSGVRGFHSEADGAATWAELS